MKFTPHPGYERHLEVYEILAHGTKEQKQQAFLEQQQALGFTFPETVHVEDRTIPGPKNAPAIPVRIIRPVGLKENAPVVLDVHGGGFVGGNIDIDNYRNTALATGTPCIVVSVGYRLAPAHPFPAALLDCYAALNWIVEHAASFGGDGSRVGLHGTSAGGTLCAALCLYARDNNGPRIRMAVLNCPALSQERYPSTYQMDRYALGDASDWARNAEQLYLGGFRGECPSYYAFPGYSPTLIALPPTMVIVAEYDPLRDDGLHYANRLLADGVPCEVLVAPRVGHGFCTVDAPLTRWVHAGVCASFAREFASKV